MATLKLVLLKAKALKDGTHKIRIAVCHKTETTYIITRFIVEENQFKNGQVVKRPDASIINRKLRALLDEYQDTLDSIKHPNLYTCAQLKNIVEHGYNDEDTTFQNVSESYEKELIKKGKHSYAKLLARNRQLFTEYFHGDCPIADVTIDVLEGYTEYLRNVMNYSDTMNGMQMRHTRTIVNRAVKKRLVTYDVNPFVGFTIPAPAVREIDLSLESFNKIRNAVPVGKPFRVARDLFLLSFYLGGMNLIDILNVDFREDGVSYVRTKTMSRVQGIKEITFSIPREAKEIAAPWMDKKTGKLALGYKFEYEHFRSYVGRELRKLVRQLGVEEKVMFYSARKTFAQFASDLGIPDGIIDYCLGHSDKSKGVIRYYTKVRQKQADMAIARVIDYVKNPDKYKEYIELKSDIMLMRG